MGGLMEDPYPHWEVVGEAEGETLQEIADNLAKTDEEFHKYYDPKGLTFWGWILHLAPAPGETVGNESLKFLA